MPKKIAVIGAGVIGVLTALEIQDKLINKGLIETVTIFGEKFSPETTGDVSAGLWTPYILQDTPMNDIIKWSKETQNFALKLWREGKAEEAGISLIPMLSLTKDEKLKIPPWISVPLGHYILNAEDLKRINKETNSRYVKGVSYVSFIIEPSKLLPYLQNLFIKAGGKIVQKKITNINELSKDFDVVINCTGLNGPNLNDDDQLGTVPIRGQVLRVRTPWQFHVVMDDDNYIIPNINCVILGGTHEENDFGMEIRKNDTVFILKGCSKIVPAIKHAEIVTYQAGLRPGRKSVLVSKQWKSVDGKRVLVIHNYGHGGSGVTLSKGCALQVRKLVEDELHKGTLMHKL